MINFAFTKDSNRIGASGVVMGGGIVLCGLVAISERKNDVPQMAQLLAQINGMPCQQGQITSSD